MEQHIRENLTTGLKGLLGTTTSSAGIYVSTLPELEAWLRIGALVVSITVGVFTIWSIACNRKKP
ncbi:MAG: hypothetical protein KGL39_15645 [Patescibacteria group bacterium]|nr:hypothetical protein [Patescibacteria group bacterium]